MSTSSLRLISLVLVAALLLTACAGATMPPPERPPLKIGWTLWPGFYPLVIADKQGLFARHGVAVEPIQYDYSEVIVSLQSGQVDGSLLTLNDTLLVEGREPGSVRVVLVVDSSAGADVVIATADVMAPADLKGKAVGTGLGTFGELLIRTMLQANGLTTDDVTLINVDGEAVPDMIPEAIQAGNTWEPHASEALAKGNRVIFSSADAPGLIADVLAFRASAVKERPDDIRAFVAAWFEALAWWQANPAAGNAIIAEATGLKPEEIWTDGLKLFNRDDNMRAFTDQAATGTDFTSLYASGRANTEFLISTGGLTHAPDLERLLDSSFLR